MHASASATIHKLPLLTVTEMELNFEQLAISGKPSGYNFPKDRPTEACGVPIIVELSTRIRSTDFPRGGNRRDGIFASVIGTGRYVADTSESIAQPTSYLQLTY